MRDEPCAYQLALAAIMGAVVAAVLALDVPLWPSALLVAGSAAMSVGLLKSLRRSRETHGPH